VKLLEKWFYQELRPLMAICSLNPPGNLAIVSAFTEIPLSHVARGVWTVTLPPAATRADFEYLVQVTTGKNQLLHFPATAPEMNQTVVVRETK